MYPPADPWASHDPTWPEPSDRPAADRLRFERAAVPVPAVPLREPTAELPSVSADPALRSRPARPVSWYRTSSASLRSISDGWGFTAAGLLVTFCGWGVWAAALRGTGSSALSGLVFMLVVAAGLFALARFLGYLVVERIFQRPRIHARWAHFLTGLFLTVAGMSYLINTPWLADAAGWFQDAMDWIRHMWNAG